MSHKIHKNTAMLLCDIFIFIFASLISVFIRFDLKFSSVPPEIFESIKALMPFHIVLSIAVFYAAGLYSMDLHSVGFVDVANAGVTVGITNVTTILFSSLSGHSLPVSIYLFTMFIELVLVLSERCCIRFLKMFSNAVKARNKDLEKIMLIGAGGFCDMLLREMEMDPKFNVSVKCIIDDNKGKLGSTVRGVKVVGNRYDIPKFCEEYKIDKIILAIPTISGNEKKKILDICAKTGARVQTLPGMFDLVNDSLSLSSLRDINIGDLLGRDEVILDDTAINKFLYGKTVMVTGGGGSIGSEICRQVAERFPKKLIILDIYENNAYDIQQELIRKYGDSLDLTVEIASVRDKKKIYELFQKHHPDVVFHAAAHKHVPLMEYCPSEAIKNNIFGTYHVVRASEKFGVSKFILISTDKAVNPTNIMGATKRFCEMIIQSRTDTTTEYATVRFGNVLGSNGSVVPLFTKQIEAGGPVTITDKRVIRYFMTIPEASRLVLQAGAMAKKNQVFVLDMGEPVRILDLAEKMIRLAGKKPYKDIEIVETGLRPGEKLYEELLMKSENLEKTAHSDIYVEKQGELDRDKIYDGLKRLDELVSKESDYSTLSNELKDLVPTYHDPEFVNGKVKMATENSDGSEDKKSSLNELASNCLKGVC